jgi:hypothetical protein
MQLEPPVFAAPLRTAFTTLFPRFEPTLPRMSGRNKGETKNLREILQRKVLHSFSADENIDAVV